MPPNADLSRALEIYHRLEDFWRTWMAGSSGYHDAYFQHHWTSALQEGDYQVTLPMESLVIDTALAMIRSADPMLTVFPADEESERQAADADRVERWHMGVDRHARISSGADPEAEANFNQLLYGLGWIREVAKFPKEWATDYDPAALRYDFPLVKQSVHPWSIMHRWGRYPGGIGTLTYEADYTVEEIEIEWDKTLRLRQDEKGRFMARNPFETRRVVELWEWRTEHRKPVLYHSVFTPSPDEWVKPPTAMPEYRRIPYYRLACFQTGEDLPHERFLSFLYKLQEIPHLTEIVVSREMRMAEMYIDPIVLAKSASGRKIPIEKTPGAVIDMGPEDDVRYLSYQGTPPDLPRVRDLLLNMGYLAGFSPAILTQGHGDSSLARSMDVEQSLFKIASPVRHYKEALEEMYWHRACLAKSFSRTVRVPVNGETAVGKAYTVALTGDALARHADVSVKIRPGLYSRLLADINVATQAVNGGLWSLDDAMDFLGVRDKASAKRAIKRDKVEMHPDVISMEKDVYLKELRTSLEGDGLLDAEAAPPGAGPGMPPGMPGLPPGPTANEPTVQGIGNSLRALAGGNSQPNSPAELQAQQLRRVANGGAPTSVPTTAAS